MLYKKNINFFKTLNIKSCIFGILGLFFIFYMLLNPIDTLNSAKKGLTLWYQSVVPSLLPFLIITDIVVQTDIIYIFGVLTSPIMKTLFKEPGESSIALLLGLISGYPVGAKITCDLYKNSTCNKNEAQRLLGFTNNCGPMFFLGATAIGIYGIPAIGPMLLASHYAGSLTIGIISRKYSKKQAYQPKSASKIKKRNNISKQKIIGNIISESIQKSTALIIAIGGLIILFSVVIAALQRLIPMHNNLLFSVAIGSIEMTNGVNCIKLLNCSLFLKMIATSFIIGFGGISVVLQTLTVLKSTDLKIKDYIINKLLHGVLASAYCMVFYNFFVNKKSLPVNNLVNSATNQSTNLFYIINNICAIICIFSFIIFLIHKIKKIMLKLR